MGFERDKVSWAPNMNPLFVEGKLSMVRVFKGQLSTWNMFDPVDPVFLKVNWWIYFWRCTLFSFRLITASLKLNSFMWGWVKTYHSHNWGSNHPPALPQVVQTMLEVLLLAWLVIGINNMVESEHTHLGIPSDKHTVTTFKYVEGGPDREAPEVVWNTSSYI